MKKSDFVFDVIEFNNQELKFYHNLSKEDIEGDIINWYFRADDDDINVKSFNAYVAGKRLGSRILTVEEYEKLE